MKNVSIAMGIAVMLVACGGGGSDSSSSSAAATSSAATPATSSTTGQKIVPPDPPANVITIFTKTFSEGSNSQNDDVFFTDTVNLTVTGRLNSVWVRSKQPGGSATISSDSNTIIIMPGVTATFTVTGSGNIFYVPVGSAATIIGTGAASSTIRNYTPAP